MCLDQEIIDMSQGKACARGEPEGARRIAVVLIIATSVIPINTRMGTNHRSGCTQSDE